MLTTVLAKLALALGAIDHLQFAQLQSYLPCQEPSDYLSVYIHMYDIPVSKFSIVNKFWPRWPSGQVQRSDSHFAAAQRCSSGAVVGKRMKTSSLTTCVLSSLPAAPALAVTLTRGKTGQDLVLIMVSAKM